MSNSQVLFSAAAQDVHTSGNTPDIQCDQATSIAGDLNLGAFTGGASPSVTFTLQRKDALGNYNPMRSTAALTAAGYASMDAGPGTAAGGNAQVPTNIIRLAWVTAGAPTAVTCAISLIGRV